MYDPHSTLRAINVYARNSTRMNDRTPPIPYVYLTLAVAAMLGSALVSGADDPRSAEGPASQPAAQSTEEVIAKLGRGIVGSKHDFSDAGQVPRDLCTPCHTPHITAAQAPLLVSRAANRTERSYQTKA